MSDTDLSKSKIININDFIFRQNLEFYPNLSSLICENNILYLKKDNKIVDNVALTFDLRTLPGESWNVTPENFLNIIRLNKECANLYKFGEFMRGHAHEKFLDNNEEMRQIIDKFMQTYFIAKDSTNLTENNKILLSQAEFVISSLPDDSDMKKIINEIIDKEFDNTKMMGNTKSLAVADSLKQQGQAPVRALTLVKKEEYPLASNNKAAFINIAILLYGIVNVGLIMAIALMK